MSMADYETLSTNSKVQEWNGNTIHFKITALDANTYQTYEIDGYLLTRENQDGSLYGIRVVMGKAGGAEAWCDQWAKGFTEQLKTTPLVDLCKKGMHQCFEPSGGTNVPGIARCDSPIDLICKIIMMKYAKEAWAEMHK